MKSARIREATVARRYQTTRRGARRAAAAQESAPRTTAETGTGQFRAVLRPATAAIGTSQSAAAAACRDDHRRGSRHRASAATHASAPVQRTAACPSRMPVSVASRGAVHGCSEKCRRSTAAGSRLRPITHSNRTSSPASSTPQVSWVAMNKAV